MEDGEGYNIEVGLKTAAGNDLRVHIMGTPWFKGDEVDRVIGVISDVTKKKEAEKALLKAKEAAEAANIAKSQFLATMSHEIRTPLNAILGMTQILREDPDTEDRDEFMDIIIASGRSLTNLISDILDFSKIEANEIELDVQEFALSKWIEETIRLVSGAAKEKGLKLESKIEPSLEKKVWLDGPRFRQVLLNLLGNAIKFTKTGFVRLEARSLKSDRIEISIVDSGVGVPKSKQKEIFETFRQADSSNTRNFDGAGLGLSICDRLVHLMGGTIEVESEVGKGSTFRVEFPLGKEETLDDDETGKEDPALIEEYKPSNRPEILIVEDNPVNLRVMCIMIQKQGYTYQTASGGREAVEMCKAQRYRVIFMDMQMPDTDGLEATRMIKEDPEYGNPYIVIFSASVQSSDREASFQAGADEFLSKPVRVEQVKKILADQMAVSNK